MGQIQYRLLLCVVLFSIVNMSNEQSMNCGFGQFRTANNDCFECLSSCSKCMDLTSPCSSCAQGQRLNTTSIKCENCGLGQLQCASGVITCEPHYSYVFGKCLVNCRVTNCDQCANAWVRNCTKCKSGYTLNDNKTTCTASRNLQQVQLPQPLDAMALIASLDKQFNMSLSTQVPAGMPVLFSTNTTTGNTTLNTGTSQAVTGTTTTGMGSNTNMGLISNTNINTNSNMNTNMNANTNINANTNTNMNTASINNPVLISPASGSTSARSSTSASGAVGIPQLSVVSNPGLIISSVNTVDRTVTEYYAANGSIISVRPLDASAWASTASTNTANTSSTNAMNTMNTMNTNTMNANTNTTSNSNSNMANTNANSNNNISSNSNNINTNTATATSTGTGTNIGTDTSGSTSASTMPPAMPVFQQFGTFNTDPLTNLNVQTNTNTNTDITNTNTNANSNSNSNMSGGTNTAITTNALQDSNQLIINSNTTNNTSTNMNGFGTPNNGFSASDFQSFSTIPSSFGEFTTAPTRPDTPTNLNTDPSFIINQPTTTTTGQPILTNGSVPLVVPQTMTAESTSTANTTIINTASTTITTGITPININTNTNTNIVPATVVVTNNAVTTHTVDGLLANATNTTITSIINGTASIINGTLAPLLTNTTLPIISVPTIPIIPILPVLANATTTTPTTITTTTPTSITTTTTSTNTLNTIGDMPVNGTPVITNTLICEPGMYATPTGCQGCFYKCATCINSADQCMECSDGYRKVGWKCVRNQTVEYNLTLGYPTGVTSPLQLTNSMASYMGSLKSSILSTLLPSAYQALTGAANPLTFNSIKINEGLKSINVVGLVDKIAGTHLLDLKNSIANKLKSITALGPFPLLAHNILSYPSTANTVTNEGTYVNPGTHEETRGPNLAAILIPSIIGGLLFLSLLCCLLCYCCKWCCFKDRQFKVQHKPKQLQTYNQYNQAAPTHTERNFIDYNKGSQKVVYRDGKQPMTFAPLGAGSTLQTPSKYSDENKITVIEYQVSPEKKQSQIKNVYESNLEDEVVDYANDDGHVRRSTQLR